MFSFYEIILIIIAFIALFTYFKNAKELTSCESEEEENFGNFTSAATSSPVIAYIKSKYNLTTDVNIKKTLFIPQIFSNNALYKDSDYSLVSKMSFTELGTYVKNKNTLYFIDLLNQFTQDNCDPSDLKLLLSLFANNYITFKNITLTPNQEDVNTTLSKHFNLYVNVKNIAKSYFNLLTNKTDITTLNQTATQIDSTLNNVVQQLPPINTVIDKIKKINFTNNYGNFNDTVDKNSINIYKQQLCASINLNTITGSSSQFLNQIKSYNVNNNRNKFNKGNIQFWIPTYVQINLTNADIEKANNLNSVKDVFTIIIFPKIFNYSLILIDLMTKLNNNQTKDIMNKAIDFFIRYVSTYLLVYMNVITGQTEMDVLLDLQKLESRVMELYNLIMTA
jgi:hypothetical protein